jgi:alanine racemase
MHIYNFDESFYDTYAEINLGALKNNFNLIKKEAQKNSKKNPKGKNHVKICAVVKANAYGHGFYGTSLALAEFGADYLGTADYVESLSLRKYLNKHGQKSIPIVCLGTLKQDKKLIKEIIRNKIDITITDLKSAVFLNDSAKSINAKPDVHIQFDTGMNRVGITEEKIIETIRKIAKLENINLKGIYSHFATSEIKDHSFAKKQLKLFINVVRKLETEGIKFELKHMQNSGGIFNYKNDFFNMVRPGISLYGYYPDTKAPKNDIGLVPVMSLKSRVNMIKEVKKNRSISYGRRYFTKEKTLIASVPVGYGDGYYRGLTNKAKVIINGKKYKTVGTVCMDWVMVNIKKNEDIKVGDRVILLGPEYPAYEHSKIVNTIPYEITCHISPRVKRIYVK